ncbi:MAG: hypothetical protein K2Y01_08005 [Rhabdochlamydiaceae bacterium]|nr:hypothetical protein [Rhabdochlamydiaceae bacterium]
MKDSPELPVWQSVLWIIGSSLLISGGGYRYLHKKPVKMESPLLQISYIVQTGLQKEVLHADYLAELLGLSFDNPTQLSDFDEESAQKALLSSAIIKEASVKKILPNMVYIDYSVRKPMGWIADFVNTAIDQEGYVFPVSPFFSPKKLPEFYLGKEGLVEAFQGKDPAFAFPLQGRYIDLAYNVLDLFQKQGNESFTIKRIDVSQAFYPTLGKRGIVVLIENGNNSLHFLRMSTAHVAKEVANYLNLRPHLEETDLGKDQRVIDLRLPQLAFVD